MRWVVGLGLADPFCDARTQLKSRLLAAIPTASNLSPIWPQHTSRAAKSKSATCIGNSLRIGIFGFVFSASKANLEKALFGSDTGNDEESPIGANKIPLQNPPRRDN